MDNINGVMENLKILYVEDEDVTRAIMQKVLKKRVGKLFVAKDGKEGLESFKTYRPEIVITDLRMPNSGGIEMIKEIRKIDQDCGIIINTEIGDVDYILKSIDIGIDKYLIKPVGQEDLDKCLKDVASKIVRRIHRNQMKCILEFNKEEKVKIEGDIKGKISSFLKKNTGKGPKDIQVFLKWNLVEVQVYDVLTSMETTLLESGNNGYLVEYNRKLFYKSQQEELEKIITDSINRHSVLNKIEVNILKNMDEMIYGYC